MKTTILMCWEALEHYQGYDPVGHLRKILLWKHGDTHYKNIIDIAIRNMIEKFYANYY